MKEFYCFLVENPHEEMIYDCIIEALAEKPIQGPGEMLVDDEIFQRFLDRLYVWAHNNGAVAAVTP